MDKGATIQEMFCSIQGEGSMVGTPALFIRFAGCNLACSWCDTDWKHGKTMSRSEFMTMADMIMLKNQPSLVVFTGGEPGLQLQEWMVSFFKQKRMLTAVETNGTQASILNLDLDLITCSPKLDEPGGELQISWCHELKFVIKAFDPLPQISQNFFCKRKYLSPMFDGDEPNEENIAYVLKMVVEHPDWSISMQQHKLWGVR